LGIFERPKKDLGRNLTGLGLPRRLYLSLIETIKAGFIRIRIA